MGVSAHIVNLVEHLHEFNSMEMRVAGEQSEAFQAEQGVSQGCILSPQLFDIYNEHIIRKVLEHWAGDISIRGRRISSLRNAGDTTSIASDEV